MAISSILSALKDHVPAAKLDGTPGTGSLRKQDYDELADFCAKLLLHLDEELVPEKIMLRADIPTLFSQCQALSNRILTIDEAVKSLDVQEVAFQEKEQQITDELEWLESTQRKDIVARRKELLAAAGHHATWVGKNLDEFRIDTDRSTDEYLSIQKIEDRVAVEFAVMELPLIGASSFQTAGQAVYVSTLKSITGSWPMPGNRENFYSYAAAYGRAWSVRRDLYLNRSTRLEAAIELKARISQAEASLAETIDREEAFNEDVAAKDNRINCLNGAKLRMTEIRSRPGFSYGVRAKSLAFEFLASAANLEHCSTAFAFQLSRQLGIGLEAFSFTKMQQRNKLNELEEYLANFRNSLSRISIALDAASMKSLEGSFISTVDLAENSGKLIGKCVINSALTNVKILSIAAIANNGPSGKTIDFEIVSGKIHFQTSSITSLRTESNRIDHSVRGKLLAALSMPFEIMLSLPSDGIEKENIDIVICFERTIIE
jgi:hypothetical protein